MTNEQLKKTFITFLAKEGVLFQFYSNFHSANGRKWRSSFVHTRTLEMYIKEYEPYLYIRNAFHWNETHENHLFWYKLEIKWQKLTENKKVNT